MSDYTVTGTKDGFTLKLWRGERMCLLGFDVVDPEPDFVGFAVEYLEPGDAAWKCLHNRIAFDYPAQPVNGYRNWPTLVAPLQKFRWVHFPWEVRPGIYGYRVTKMHMRGNGTLVKGTCIERSISLEPVTWPGFLDIGFTRNFASSQAFQAKLDQWHVQQPIIPALADEGLDFADARAAQNPEIYKWLGFDGAALLFEFLDEALADPEIQVDAMIYDLNEPEILRRLEALGRRLRVIIDDSSKTNDDGVKVGHGGAESCETAAAERLRASAGADHVHRGHFGGLQHNKVFIARRGGQARRVLAGSTNFTFRGLYIQANNVLVFNNREISGLFGEMFDLAFDHMRTFRKDPLARKWHAVTPDGLPPIHLCFSPHSDPDLALAPVGGAIDQASSSVFYAIAFLGQTTKGPVRAALDRLMDRPLFSYGVSDKRGQLELRKPNGSKGLVDFKYLAKRAPEPFRTEWSGGRGINIHHKFVVTDFNLPSARVFTGSSNLAPSGEKNNGDHLIMIQDPRVATAYAIEALRMFDHLHFRVAMSEAGEDAPTRLALKKPEALSGEPAWFEASYVPGSQRARDRVLFSS